MRWQVVASRLLAIALCWDNSYAATDEPATADSRWKLTFGEYSYAGYAGTDLNLRWRANATSAWAGIYTDRVFGTQARAGADTSIDVGPYVQLQPSVQVASRGFAGGSFSVQLGGPWYAEIGRAHV